MYLDTSVLVAYYCPEVLSDQVESLLRRQSAPIVSELAEVELSSAIAMKVREKDLDRSDAFHVLTQFQKNLDDPFLQDSLLTHVIFNLPKHG